MQDPRFTEFIHLFNSHKFFEAHEVLEDLWLETHGNQKTFYQGLIQCAVALAHWQRNNPRGAKQVAERALAKLRNFDPEKDGIHVSALIQDIEAFLASSKSNFPRIQTNSDSAPESQ